MKKQKGIGLIGVLLIIGALVTAGGLLVWLNQRQPSIPNSQSTKPSPEPPTQVSPTPTSFVHSNACVLEPKAGSCLALVMKFFYDQSVQRCRPFSWGGCGGVVPFQTLEDCQSLCEPKIQGPLAKIPDSVKKKITQIKEALAADENDVSHLSDSLIQISRKGNLLLEYHSTTLIDETKKEDLRKFGNLVSISGDGDQGYFIVVWISHHQIENAARLSWVSAVKPVAPGISKDVRDLPTTVPFDITQYYCRTDADCYDEQGKPKGICEVPCQDKALCKNGLCVRPGIPGMR